MTRQRRWQRRTLLAVLGYEGAGALVGGAFLIAAPDGRLMDMPVSIMHGVFRDFFIPGVILFALGLLNSLAFFAVLRRSRADGITAALGLGGLMVWFFVEIVILRDLHWLHVMWGFPVLLGVLVAAPLLPFQPGFSRKCLLSCGIASSLLYILMNVAVPLGWPAYDSASQTVSELSAIGAPTRPLWVVLGMLYTMLVVSFGIGVRMSAGQNRRLRLAGSLLVLYGALGIIWPFAPMHLRETLAAGGGTASDTLHLALGVATEIIYLLALGFAGAALGRAFRVYSIATFVALVAFAVPVFVAAPGIGTNQATPLIGVWERINIGVFLLWMVVLAITLLGSDRARQHIPPSAIGQAA